MARDNFSKDSHVPSDKQQRYDRQLRLWASKGQDALESAHVVFVNSGSGVVAIEALKNMILPGIGRFTVIDDAVVDESDLGSNFFLSRSSIGSSRARLCADLLTELNTNVIGDWRPKEAESRDLSDILQSLSSVSLLLYTYPLTSYDHGVIDEFSQHNGIPIIAIHSAGFYSYFRLYLPALFPIIETHLDLPPVLDLRLYNPWPELSSFLAQLTKDINSADDHTHSHIPFVAIVVHYLDAWKRNHGGRLPTTSRDKTSFRDILQSATRVHGPAGFEENFGEAITMLQRVLAEPALPQGLREAFNLLDQEISLREDRSHFWTLCRGLKSFYELHNHLPLSGRIPDMKAQSQVYVDLQRIYKQKAARDADEVSKLIIDEDKCSLPQTTEVTLFCQNAFAIRVIPPSKPHSTVHGQEPVPMPSRFIDQIARSDPQSVLPIYVVLRAISYVKAPATINDVMKLVSKLVPDVELHDGIVDIAQHIIRAQAAELHNISSITGGLVAQEAIKILTRQYVPIDNTCIFDGIRSRCGVLRI